MPAVTHVAVAVVSNRKGQVLISKRPDHVHQGGRWEFPGGKLEAAESVEAALVRELREELGIRPVDYRPLIRLRHEYADRPVLLDVWLVSAFSGFPHGRENQPVIWKAVKELDPAVFPAANAGILKAVRLPSRHLITGRFQNVDDYARRLQASLDSGIRLVQLRLDHAWFSSHDGSCLHELIAVSRALCGRAGATLVFNLAAPVAGEIRPGPGEGLHLNSRRLMRCSRRPDAGVVSASCHDPPELAHACRLGLDFVLLSPVQPTPSHPGAATLGWKGFRELSETATLPVYALGGMTSNDRQRSWRYGAQGIAAISEFWGRGGPD